MTHKQKVLQLLSDNRPHSHLEGYRLGVMLHSRVADLRKDGYMVKCWYENKAWMYQLFGTVRTGELADYGDGQPSPARTVLDSGPPDGQSPKTPESVETVDAAGPGPFSPPAGARQLSVFEAA